ncbi:MAG TPA: nucleotidyltransferase domain-containing protein [Allosphingosinicella sp.]|jgi:predicted nucleotidyltransferase
MEAPAETVDEAIAFTRRLVASHYPQAQAALLAGSRARGEARPGSDYDVFLLFRALPEGAWREKTWFEGRAFELFGHDLGTLSYFCRTVVARSAVPSVPEMVAHGIIVLGEGSAPLASARELARRTFAAGPPRLDEATKRARLSALTELREILASCKPGPALTSVGAALYPVLADFTLRSSGTWSASVKRMPAALAELDPVLGDRFVTAFAALFGAADSGPVLALADSIMARHGARPGDSFRIASPPNWRD